MKYLTSSFYYWDWLGPTADLSHKGDNRYRTFVGVFFTFVACVFTILSIYPSISDVFKRENPNVFSERLVNLTSPLSITNHKFKVFFVLKNFNKKTRLAEDIPVPLDDNKHLLRFELVSETSNGITPIKFKDSTGKDVTEVPLISCTKSTTLDEFNNHQHYGSPKFSPPEVEALKKRSYCLPPNLNFDILKTYKGSTQNFLIKVVEDVDKRIGLNMGDIMFLEVHFLELAMDVNHIDQPFKSAWNELQMIFQLGMWSRATLGVKKVEVIVDKTIFIFTDKRKPENFFFIERDWDFDMRLDLDNLPPSTLGYPPLEIIFTREKIDQKITITYQTISNLLVNFGGIKDVWLELFGAIVCKLSLLSLGLIVDPYFMADMMNTAFKYHLTDLNEEQLKEIFKSHKHIKIKECDTMKSGSDCLSCKF